MIEPRTVSRETAERLVAAGWIKETHVILAKEGNAWFPWCQDHDYVKAEYEWLPAPTADEIAGDLKANDLLFEYKRLNHIPIDKPTPDQYWPFFSDYLWRTRNSADAMADVWIDTHGKEGER